MQKAAGQETPSTLISAMSAESELVLNIQHQHFAAMGYDLWTLETLCKYFYPAW